MFTKVIIKQSKITANGIHLLQDLWA